MFPSKDRQRACLARHGSVHDVLARPGFMRCWAAPHAPAPTEGVAEIARPWCWAAFWLSRVGRQWLACLLNMPASACAEHQSV